MEDNTAISRKLREILTSEAFEQLEPFKNTKGWEPMSTDDKELLAQLFIGQGKRHLRNHDERAQEMFALAEQAAPKSALIFTEIGNAYCEHHEYHDYLQSACQAYERASQLKPMYSYAWMGWARALRLIGDLEDEPSLYMIAQKYLERTDTLIDPNNVEIKAELSHEWGQLWSTQGISSGEACDFHKALEYYRQAEFYGLHTADFYNDYANCLRHLSKLLEREDLMTQALTLYKKAHKLDRNNLDTLHNLIDLLCILYPQTGNFLHYSEALQHFESLAILNENGPDFWLLWGSLLSFQGKLHNDFAAVEASLDKLQIANELDPNNPVVLVRWAESLRILGANNEDIEKLRGAEEKVILAIQAGPQNIEAWYLYGIILCEIGRYFCEQTYYIEALDKFRYGLARDQQSPVLWYGLAQVYLALGELTHDRSFYEKAVAAYTRSFEFGSATTPQFWNGWGVTLMKMAESTDAQNLVEEAIEKFERALAIAERIEPEWLYNYGCAFDFLGDITGEPEHYEKAIMLLHKVLEIDPDYLPATYNLALAFSHLGETIPDIECLNRSSEYFQKLLQSEPEDDLAWNDWGTTLLHMAQFLYDPALPEQSFQMYAQAEEKFLQAQRLGCIHALYNLACLHSLTSKLDDAIHYIQKAEENHALPPVDDLIQDEWLDNLRQTNEFRGFLTQLANKRTV
jgi:tetratricopeptide (TPR) repeat protein